MGAKLIGGRFRLVEELASGGFGTVWRAFDETLGIEVALKQIKLDPTATGKEREKARSRAEHEARNAARLRDHPNIVTVYDVVTENGSPWLVMRLVKGHSVHQQLEAHGRMHLDNVTKIAAGVLNALAAAHEAGIVHRDVKPANIMLGDDCAILLTDFGIAKHHADTTQTTRGMLIGSLPYMSPERLNGEDLPSGDLFALGATLYEMTEGTPAFPGTTPAAIMSAVVLNQPPAPAHAGNLAPLITALLEKDPDNRPDAAGALKLLNSEAKTARLVIVDRPEMTKKMPTPEQARRAAELVGSVMGTLTIMSVIGWVQEIGTSFNSTADQAINGTPLSALMVVITLWGIVLGICCGVRAATFLKEELGSPPGVRNVLGVLAAVAAMQAPTFAVFGIDHIAITESPRLASVAVLVVIVLGMIISLGVLSRLLARSRGAQV